MTDWIGLALVFAIIAAGPAFAWLYELSHRPSMPERPVRAGEPCWTEEVAEDGDRKLARSLCVDDVLMEMDARAVRGDFPIPRSDGGG